MMYHDVLLYELLAHYSRFVVTNSSDWVVHAVQTFYWWVEIKVWKHPTKKSGGTGKRAAEACSFDSAISWRTVLGRSV